MIDGPWLVSRDALHCPNARAVAGQAKRHIKYLSCPDQSRSPSNQISTISTQFGLQSVSDAIRALRLD